MHVITIAGSNHQKSRLKNGHKVRVKHGEGFNVVVNPTTYHLVSRAFNKNKGTTMQLTPEEIEMNRAPSPEMQAKIMGHSDHLILPNPMGVLVKGSGIGDFFKNLGNQIKSKVIDPIQNKVIDPIQNKIYNPIKNVYEQNVPESVRRDISTVGRFSSIPGTALDFGKRIAKGEKPGDIAKSYFEDLKHLNATKNKIVKSSPVLTDLYKQGVMATAGLGSAALGTTLGLNPATGALAGAAGSMAAQELLKAEGYGLHHAIVHGIKHHYDELKHHLRPIGGRITLKHVKDFFVNAGRKIAPVLKHGAKEAHNFILNNPALANKIKEHGSKLAGMLAKAGANYLTGDEKYGEEAEKYGSKFGDEQIHKNLGYGLTAGVSGSGAYGCGLGTGLYAGKMRGTGAFHSFDTMRNAANGYAKANDLLSDMSRLTIHGQHIQQPIQKMYDGDLEPRSRGSGMHPHTAHHIQQNNHLHHRGHTTRSHDTNLIRGRGTLVEHDAELPPALVSQPYGANFHMQFQLPPQYQKYNDGTYTY